MSISSYTAEDETRGKNKTGGQTVELISPFVCPHCGVGVETVWWYTTTAE